MCHPSGGVRSAQADVCRSSADDVWPQYRQTEESRSIGRNDALGFSNVFKGQAAIREKLIADCVGAEEKTYKAGVRSAWSETPSTISLISFPVRLRRAGMDKIVTCHLALGLGSGFFGLPSFVRFFVKAPTNPIRVQCDIDSVDMDLDAQDA